MFVLQMLMSHSEAQLEHRKCALLLEVKKNHNKIICLNESVKSLQKEVKSSGWTEKNDSLFDKYEHELILVEKQNESHSIIFEELEGDFSQFYGMYIWIYRGLALVLFTSFMYLVIKL